MLLLADVDEYSFANAVVQVMACWLWRQAIKLLPEPMMIYCESDPLENSSVKL